jgi:hypothetical protein
VTATERFKMLLANALERVCVLEAELERLQEAKKMPETEQGPIPDPVEVRDKDESDNDSVVVETERDDEPA